jgi:hypothetical protein
MNILRKKKKRNNRKPQQKSNHRLQQVADYQPADRLKGRNTNIHPFVCPAEEVKKRCGSTHQQRQLANVCVDVVFHRNLLSADGTDQRVLSPALRPASRA